MPNARIASPTFQERFENSFLIRALILNASAGSCNPGQETKSHLNLTSRPIVWLAGPAARPDGEHLCFFWSIREVVLSRGRLAKFPFHFAVLRHLCRAWVRDERRG